MKISLFFAIGILFLSGCNSTQNIHTAPSPETTSLDSVLKLVTSDYNTAMDYLGGENKVTACQASVTFDVLSSKTAGAHLSVIVFRAGYTQSWNHEITVTYNLEQGKIKPRLRPTLTNNFQRAIVNAALQFHSIKDSAYLGGLVGSSFSVDIAFVITRAGDLAISLFDDVAGVNARYEKDVTQRIHILFALPGKCPG
ncbi:MAG: hypothetical protein M3N30_05270 [Bacteroidota bacterium]|nr:hypothetical protein [Bacteroidota bacterium]